MSRPRWSDAVVAAAVAALVGALVAPTSAAAVTRTTRPAVSGTQVGAPCTRPGAVGVSGGQRIVCVRSGTRFVWQLAERAPGGGTFPSTTARGGPTTTVAGRGPTTRPGAPAALPPPASDAAGRWIVGAGSQVGYRIEERMLGGAFAGARTAVGRTPAVSGSLVVRRDAAGMAATVTVDADLRELASDSPRRDQVLRTEGLVTNQFPGASFFADVRIPAGADTGRDFAVDVVGKLTLKGATRDVGVRLTGRLELGRVLVVGNATITLADFGIAPPDVAGVVDVADQGQLEFSLLFVKGA